MSGPLDILQPGDAIVYLPDWWNPVDLIIAHKTWMNNCHVACYIGQDKVVQAILNGKPADGEINRGPNCETIQLARMANIPGDETAIIKTDWRLGGDGAWHVTGVVIIEWNQATGSEVG